MRIDPEKVLALRTERGLSQGEVAELAILSRSTIARLEGRDRTSLRPLTALALAGALGVEIDDIAE